MTGGYRPFDGDAWLGRELPLTGGPYRVLPESAFDVAEEMAFARQGRKARVFKLLGPDGAPYALKTFYRGFSLPEYLPITTSLRAFDDIRGLRVLQRRLVDAEEAAAIGEPGLAYAILMPWIEGVAWAAVVEERFHLAEEACVALAAQTAHVLGQLEGRGLAHADLSSSNILITDAEGGPVVELIDVEDMYHEAFGELPYVPDGSPGYAHPANQGHGCRNAYGDRFAGAILLTEMLVWHDPAVRQSTVDISVFDRDELCRPGSKYDLVRTILDGRSAELATLFTRAWQSAGPSDCPPLVEWATAVASAAKAGAIGKPTHAAGPAGEINRPHATKSKPQAAVTCPGCRRSVPPRHSAAHHAPACPLRPPSGSAPVPDKSSFPGVPTYDDIGFIPLFGDDNPSGSSASGGR